MDLHKLQRGFFPLCGFETSKADLLSASTRCHSNCKATHYQQQTDTFPTQFCYIMFVCPRDRWALGLTSPLFILQEEKAASEQHLSYLLEMWERRRAYSVETPPQPLSNKSSTAIAGSCFQIKHSKNLTVHCQQTADRHSWRPVSERSGAFSR